jgi:hypothetical protein
LRLKRPEKICVQVLSCHRVSGSSPDESVLLYEAPAIFPIVLASFGQEAFPRDLQAADRRQMAQ